MKIAEGMQEYFDDYNVIHVYVMTQEEFPELTGVSYHLAGEIREAIKKCVKEYIDSNESKGDDFVRRN